MDDLRSEGECKWMGLAQMWAESVSVRMESVLSAFAHLTLFLYSMRNSSPHQYEEQSTLFLEDFNLFQESICRKTMMVEPRSSASAYRVGLHQTAARHMPLYAHS